MNGHRLTKFRFRSSPIRSSGTRTQVQPGLLDPDDRGHVTNPRHPKRGRRRLFRKSLARCRSNENEAMAMAIQVKPIGSFDLRFATIGTRRGRPSRVHPQASRNRARPGLSTSSSHPRHEVDRGDVAARGPTARSCRFIPWTTSASRSPGYLGHAHRTAQTRSDFIGSPSPISIRLQSFTSTIVHVDALEAKTGPPSWT